MADSPSSARADIDLLAQGKRFGHIRLPYSSHESAYGWIPIPIGVVRGGSGPDVLLTAGNHGDEYEGQIALLKLMRELDPGTVQGRVIIVPRLNLPAAAAGRRTSPIDGGNLNRLFPGEAEDTPTGQIAHFVSTVLLPMTQVSLDIHSGGSSLDYLPCAFARVPEQADARALQLAALQAFGAPISILVDKPQSSRTLSAAALKHGHLHFSTEIGGSGTTRPHTQAIADQCVRRLLAHVGVVDHAPAATSATRMMRVAGPAHYVYAPVRGLFEPSFELGDLVNRGDCAGGIHFPEEPERAPREVFFEDAGTVVCRRVVSLVAPGDCLAHLAIDL
ncbi:MAG: succinylglutamate desuccinylase/aspartoacylase family protein [Burkholderiaceae bacterium]